MIGALYDLDLYRNKEGFLVSDFQKTNDLKLKTMLEKRPDRTGERPVDRPGSFDWPHLDGSKRGGGNASKPECLKPEDTPSAPETRPMC